MALKKAGGNWVQGDHFFDREVDLEALKERMMDGTHTLLSAPRRIGKTSLVRELLRQLTEEGTYETIFVDLEAASDPQDAIAEIGLQSQHKPKAWRRIKETLANFGDRIEELGIRDVHLKLRAGINAGNWRQKGEAVFQALAALDKPVVLAIDEMPILVNRLLKGQDYRMTPERKKIADEFLSWLRKCALAHQHQICLILSGSVSLEPILQQAGLSAHANFLSSYQLKPWSEETAISCLQELAETYSINLPLEVRLAMCRRLKCCIPHHVQRFFDNIHNHLRHLGEKDASLQDVDVVYVHGMLGVPGQMDLEHYENRLKLVLGDAGYRVALEILTEAAINNGRISNVAIKEYAAAQKSQTPVEGVDFVSIEEVLYVLHHDFYLERRDGGYEFVSNLLRDWWRTRYGQPFVPIARRGQKK